MIGSWEITTRELLGRIGKIYLISRKLAQTENNSREGEILSIDDQGVFCISDVWAKGKHWNKKEDLLLLQGVRKYGYGRWGIISKENEYYLSSLAKQEIQFWRSLEHKNAEVNEIKSAIGDDIKDEEVTKFMRRRMILLEKAMNAEYNFLETRELIRLRMRNEAEAAANNTTLPPLDAPPTSNNNNATYNFVRPKNSEKKKTKVPKEPTFISPVKSKNISPSVVSKSTPSTQYSQVIILLNISIALE